MKKLILITLLAGSSIALADPHHYYVTNVTGGTSVNNVNNSGTALSIAASQHSFDWGTFKAQGSVGLGSFDGTDAVSFSVGKRINNILINASVGREGNKTGYGAAFNFRF